MSVTRTMVDVNKLALTSSDHISVHVKLPAELAMLCKMTNVSVCGSYFPSLKLMH